MREIKFRAFVEWKDGTKHWEYYSTFDTPSWLDYTEIIVKDLQFTGLWDKNGKEVYEGDVMGSGKVVWLAALAQFLLLGKDWQHNMQYACHNYEVSGNIYENKNLLK